VTTTPSTDVRGAVHTELKINRIDTATNSAGTTG
jgi:hypothetical protein